MIPFVDLKAQPQPACRDLGYSKGDFPVAERAADEVLSLPIFPELSEAQIQTIAGCLHAGAVSGRR